MDRRHFLTTAAVAAGALPLAAQNYSDYSRDPRPDVPEGTLTAGSLDGPIFTGSPVVAGPAPDAITILQPLERFATGYMEYKVEDGPWVRVSGGIGGLLPRSQHAFKFRMPALPAGKLVTYRFVGHTIGWVKTKQFYHGTLKAGQLQTSPKHQFRTIDPGADSTTFAVWNDTHENSQTLQALHKLTESLKPDFLLWNGDQSNDVHYKKDMVGQFLNPAGLAVADRRPLAYVRGNHELRGPAALALPEFTGAPGDRYYYGFRSGPLAALVMDTGEDKPDYHPLYCGRAACEPMQEEQGEWLKTVVREPWFRDAPHKVLFCHIPLWFDHPKLPNNRFTGHLHCRKFWAPTLIDAGVKLVVSGHTHDYVWMPAKEGQPIPQLVGGSPNPSSATFIQGTATKSALTLKMTKLDGTVLSDIRLPT
jgi:predicted phosphodiesterase